MSAMAWLDKASSWQRVAEAKEMQEQPTTTEALLMAIYQTLRAIQVEDEPKPIGEKDRIENLIDAQDDPKSRAACMVLLRLIEDPSARSDL